MDIETFREFCLSFPDVMEDTPFQKFSHGRFTILVFYVNGHMFCYFNIDDFTNVTLKNKPETIIDLTERYRGIGKPFNGDARYWINVRLDADVDEALLKELVRQSYEIVRAGKKAK